MTLREALPRVMTLPSTSALREKRRIRKTVADDGVGRVVRGAIVGLGEDTTDDRLHAEDVKEAGDGEAGGDVLGGAAVDRGADAIGVALRGVHIGEDLLSVADVLVLAIAEQGAVPPWAPMETPLAEGSVRMTSSRGFWTGRDFTSTVSMRLKMAVFAPMPKARENTAMAVMPRFLPRVRTAKRRSCQV